MIRNSDTYGKWSKEIAAQEGVLFIDMNDLVAKKCEELGQEKTKELYIDRVHTSRSGAILNCETLITEIKSKSNFDLIKFIK